MPGNGVEINIALQLRFLSIASIGFVFNCLIIAKKWVVLQLLENDICISILQNANI
jgi:hypothetical protein